MQYAGGGSRPADWAPLAGSDPVPGHAGDLGEVARRWRDVADELERQAAAVRRLAEGAQEVGATADALREGAEDLATRLSGAVGRYRSTAGALQGYFPVLEDAQRRSLTALHAAQDAQARHDAALAVLAANSTPGPAPTPVAGDAVASAAAVQRHARDEADRTSRATTARRDAGTAAGDLEAARAALRVAEADRDTAAERAAAGITAACADDPLRDGTFDRFQQWIHEHEGTIRGIADWAGRIAAGAALLGLAVAWIPIIGPALAAVLEIVALAASVVALVGHAALLASGDGSWADLAVDVVGLATFGLGKVVGAAAEAAVPALRQAGTAARAGEAARTALDRAAAREGVDLAARGVDVADTALTMATDGMRGATRTATRDVLGISGNAVDRLRSPTRAAWRAIDADATAGRAFVASRAASAEGVVGSLVGAAKAVREDLRPLGSWSNVRQAGRDVAAMGFTGSVSAATQGARQGVQGVAAAVAHPVAGYQAAATAVRDAGSVLGAGGAGVRMAASVVGSVGLAADGIVQAVDDLTGISEGHHLPTLGGTAEWIVGGVAG